MVSNILFPIMVRLLQTQFLFSTSIARTAVATTRQQDLPTVLSTFDTVQDISAVGTLCCRFGVTHHYRLP